jgi:hypothetical protein
MASPGRLKFRQPLSAAVRLRCGPLALEARIENPHQPRTSLVTMPLNFLSIVDPIEKKTPTLRPSASFTTNMSTVSIRSWAFSSLFSDSEER